MDQTRLEVCIADLGLACKVDDKKSLTLKCGTPGFIDPEVLKGFPATPKSDIFSLGCIFYALITGNPLFSGAKQKDVQTKNQYKDP